METSSDMKNKLPAFIRFIRVVIVVAIGIAIAFVLVISREKPEKKDVAKTPPAVNVITVEPVSKVMTVDAFGTVIPRVQIKIAAEVPGRIDYIHPSFAEGGRIKKGDLLIRIDQRSYELDRQAAQVNVRQAKTDIESLEKDIENLKKDLALSRANMELVQKEFDRIAALSKNQFASRTMLDKAEQQYLQSRIAFQNIQNRMIMTQPMMEQKNAALSMARVNFEKADLAWKKARITSPFDGWVLSKTMETGDYVNPGQIIGSIYQKDSLDVDVSIPLEDMKWIDPVLKKGQTPLAKVTVAGLGDGSSSHIYPARLARFKANIDEKTRTLPLTLEIQTKGTEHAGVFDLKPGAFVKCSIQGVEYETVFVLPRHLLKPGDLLFVIADSRLAMRKATVLRKIDEDVFIIDGLNPGDKIVTSPLPGAVEGMALTIKTNGN
ncbi:MAG: efflux RND transporter periplasmic adaptor subunit [Proteobacteria bacterium]|nr:efflux RND transporter periplasmic adaptor subunit [Pseudomonadota bacterium]MBU1389335.1 efflux RND transporter periplasmic adaptor subunit [Pseudomonadota bacterium]MBU1544155.1 efflux RND transporter periplasmic adaptor subunit [Pseudomonadota bacterium]MBU2430227.1 efflux RND transporter periplasmic adaptor subunit [Pseudomonadota bacterium]MBU2482708.1 efflux RND transporter periplasmic adaptor subunit [Pseudomonadota bacterium]